MLFERQAINQTDIQLRIPGRAKGVNGARTSCLGGDSQ